MTACIRSFGAVAAVIACLPAAALAQTSKSADVAKDLVAALAAKKLDAIAAKDPADPTRYIAALYYPDTELLVIAGTYAVPQLMDARLAAKQYRDAYTELGGTVPHESRIFVMDMGVPGLAVKKGNTYYDTWTKGDKQVSFDGNPQGQKMSDADYAKTFAAADEEYARLLGALLAEAKK